MNCYLCSANDFIKRKGQVRDNPDLKILECNCCGLVMLNSNEHIHPEHYEQSGMHGDEPISIDSWLHETAWDDERRFDMLKTMLPNKKVLDFGCGNGGFLYLAKNLAQDVTGVELEQRISEYWKGKQTVLPNLQSAHRDYDLITAFHVIEHLTDPKKILKEMSECLSENGQIVVEVPSSEDALLTLFNCDSFQHFTYWSQHIFLFNEQTLRSLAKKSGLKVISIEQYQRYPLSNHLYWLSQGKPGGHNKWVFLNSSLLQDSYSAALAKIGKCDTIVGYFEKEN